ncbi:hypothetical protein TEA_014957 [Camellia sinensis var. sinensis]|uniref:Pirin N-terminal domain-containing protein n=1 Tax=Camellia sinensis var. sinensis TaxID=542762 RepID=A0A4S4E7T2_CAMSN|nr:hypothetical protein TEA_014957 [Camellia sinensis var. sinensis]
MSNVVEEPRLVVRKLLARPQHEGVGIVRRSIGRFELKYFDPFLVLDEFSVSAPAGFPDHPHRGCYDYYGTATAAATADTPVNLNHTAKAAVTGGGNHQNRYGAMTHEDFVGRKGTIGVGDLQWMTAGRGIVHSEMPASQGCYDYYGTVTAVATADTPVNLNHTAKATVTGGGNHQSRYGAMTHEEFVGRKGTIGVGDLQWMTAGRGIVHSEMPASQGTQKRLQLWINLSSKHKISIALELASLLCVLCADGHMSHAHTMLRKNSDIPYGTWDLVSNSYPVNQNWTSASGALSIPWYFYLFIHVASHVCDF